MNSVLRPFESLIGNRTILARGPYFRSLVVSCDGWTAGRKIKIIIMIIKCVENAENSRQDGGKAVFCADLG